MASSSAPSSSKRKHTTVGPASCWGLTQMNQAQQDRFRRLTRRTIIQTKFASVPTLRKLKLLAPVQTLLNKVGLADFLKVSAQTYERLTYEFLATLEKGVDPGVSEGGDGRYIRFRADDVQRVMYYPEVAKAFGWSFAQRGDYFTTEAFNSSLFYAAITNGLIFDGSAKMNSLPHPAVRFTGSLISMPILGASEPSNLPSANLRALWAMSPAGTACPDWTEYWVQICLELREHERGKISLGGMVTLLYLYLKRQEGVPSENVEFPIPASTEDPQLSFGTLVKRGMLWTNKRKNPDQFIWLYGPSGNFYIELPQPARTSLQGATSARDLYILPDEDYRGAIEKLLGKPLAPPQPVEGGVEAEAEVEVEEERQGPQGDVPMGEAGASSFSSSMFDPQFHELHAQLAYVRGDLGELRDQVDQLEDTVYPMSFMVNAMNNFYLSQPGYVDPSTAIEEDRQRRAAARASRRSGSRRPDGSSGV